MIPNVTEYELRKEQLVEECTMELTNLIYEIIERSINEGFDQFCETGKILLPDDEIENVKCLIVEREGLGKRIEEEVYKKTKKSVESRLMSYGWHWETAETVKNSYVSQKVELEILPFLQRNIKSSKMPPNKGQR